MSAGATVRTVLEAVLLAAGRPLKLDELLALFDDGPLSVDRAGLRAELRALEEDLSARAVELREVASGYRIQVRAEHAPFLARLFAEKPPRYSRALLETLALIAYRQPVTRGEIEDIRGVSVSSSIMKTLHERDWIRVLGHREVPGRPAMYGTTRRFLDDFDLRALDDLPPLAEVRDIDRFHDDLFPEQTAEVAVAAEDAAAVRAQTASTEPGASAESDAQPESDEQAGPEAQAASGEQAEPDAPAAADTQAASDGHAAAHEPPPRSPGVQ